MSVGKIIMLQGPPASGKSTRAKEIYNSNPTKYVIVSKDEIRKSRGKYWVEEQEKYIYEVEEQEIRLAIKHDLIPIIDSTNLNPKQIAKWEELAKELNCELERELIYVPLKVALERDSKRELQVTPKVIKDFYWRYFEEKYREEEYTDHTLMLQQDEELPKAVLVDLDGTVAMHNGRGPFEWNKIYTDICDFRMKSMLQKLSDSGVLIIFFTGRNKTETAFKQTDEWLSKNFDFPWILYMRDENDFRHSDICKEEMYNKYIKGKYNVLCAFDDCVKC